MTTQQYEIQTIKPRTLTINLSDADVKRIAVKAGSVGLTVPQLIENFIGDLVDGTYTNGSDERMYAGEWFDRCMFYFEPDGARRSFLRYLLTWDMVFEVLHLWDGIQHDKKILTCLEPDKGIYSEEDKAEIKDDLDFLQDELNDIFQEFVDDCNDKETYDLNSEMEKVIAWRNADSFILQEGG